MAQSAVLIDGTTRTSLTGIPLNLGGLVTPKAAATTLTVADNGALCDFATAAGYTYTLPAVERGLRFYFRWRITITSSTSRVACATGDFLVGTIMQGTDTTYLPAPRSGDGTTHLAIEGNGSTTGGFLGDWVDVVGLNDTQWYIYGLMGANGTEATPFKTS